MACMCVCACVCMCARVCVYVCVRVCLYVCVHVSAFVSMLLCSHTFVNARMHFVGQKTAPGVLPSCHLRLFTRSFLSYTFLLA